MTFLIYLSSSGLRNIHIVLEVVINSRAMSCWQYYLSGRCHERSPPPLLEPVAVREGDRFKNIKTTAFIFFIAPAFELKAMGFELSDSPSIDFFPAFRVGNWVSEYSKMLMCHSKIIIIFRDYWRFDERIFQSFLSNLHPRNCSCTDYYLIKAS